MDDDIVEFVRKRIKRANIGEMNEDLKKWMEEHGVEMEEKEEEEEEIEGTCEICEVREAKHRCIRCGKIACNSCFWTMLGICKECLPEEKLKEIKEQYF